MSTARQLYREELSRCRDSFNQVDLRRERGYLMKLTTFSANIENILPSIPRSNHENLFRELLLQRIFTSFDQNFLSAGELVKLRGSNVLFKKSDGPKIYCTYHLGSYRLLTTVLFRQGIDCVQLLGSNMNRDQGGEITELFDRIRQKYGLTNVFKIVDAGSPSAGLTMLRELKAGRSLVVYIDGSPETAPEPGEEDKFLSVRFGQRRLLTRKGVGYLSHAAKVPIVPVVSYREPDMTNVLHCLKAIKPIPKSDREMYCQEAMQQLYDAFWPYLVKYPEQWEGWNYIHSFLEPESHGNNFYKRPSKRPSFNEARYTLCDLETAPILFDRRLYQTYEITEDLRDLLLNLSTVDSISDVVGQELFSELLDLEVLH
ncbi:hypothetical protein [Spirosoma sp. KNUC1025]|uniref:hypothetical protein n=1 Tax=Spirosoma sp. KNUC1025 TaxID=2894082 RepID=UPI003863AFE7|nr:hypothetical protein LN737_09145 [Spirosoma sp. KNUC1025]